VVLETRHLEEIIDQMEIRGHALSLSILLPELERVTIALVQGSPGQRTGGREAVVGLFSVLDPSCRCNDERDRLMSR
jgi:hypothetical protein